jgi:hypothetical protein
MFSSLLLDPNDSVMADRLTRLQNQLRALQLSTREDYQAAVYSLVNAVLNLGDNMQPLVPVYPKPAIVGDLTQNLTLLNQDAGDIAAEIVRIENSAADLYNLAATSQNSLRQLVRSSLYAPTQKLWVDDFIDNSVLQSGYTATLDYNAGLATLPLSTQTQVNPTFSIGVSSVGSAGTDISNLSSDLVGTVFTWNGTSLELLLNFSPAAIVNRLVIEQDTYDGLEIVTLASTPDGLSYDDVLQDLGVDSIQMDASSGKYSGDVILDFPPRYVQQMQVVIQSRSGQASFGLRSVSAYNRSYQSSGSFTTNPITLSSQNAIFSTIETDFSPYGSIVHQISSDGVNFTPITPGNVSIPSPFWYQALLVRSANAFTQQASPVLPLIQNGTANQPYTIQNQTTNTLSSGMLEQILVLANVTGGVSFQITPLPGSLRCQVGSVFLVNGTDYSLNGNTLNFANAQTLVTVTFQTSALGAAALSALQTYYSPLLYEARFQAI